MDPSEPRGYDTDAYEAPLIALDPKQLDRHLREQYPNLLKLPTVTALLAALERIRKRRMQEDEQWVVIHYGH